LGTPSEITALNDEDIVYLTAAGDVSAVVTAKGEIYTWGKTKVGTDGSYGQN
jgi:alpha-tubulin suppressor-like RCC1 family protein